MKIKRMLVEKLNQRITAEIQFNDSLNIITGSNGSGKTTFLKACWYLYSGNIGNALREINFQKMEIETDQLTLTLTCSDPDSEDPKFSISLIPVGTLRFKAGELVESLKEPLLGTWDEIKDQLWRYRFLIALNHDSLFFPTFRRVEGGFLLGNKNERTVRTKRNWLIGDPANDDELTKALRSASNALTEFDNKFVCSMSTSDVEKLVADTKAKMDSKQKEEYEVLAKTISRDIRQWQNAGETDATGAEYLIGILTKVTQVEKERDRIVEPMQKLNSEISQDFPNRSIKVNELTLGEGKESIAATSLSAGEKQLLSFLCYAAFYGDYVFMVDEPELSLHLDWQRKLISSLTSLGASHQYFFVTHSPAIYTKFADFEISFDSYLS
jgi:predicted ATPase